MDGQNPARPTPWLYCPMVRTVDDGTDGGAGEND